MSSCVFRMLILSNSSKPWCKNSEKMRDTKEKTGEFFDFLPKKE